MITKFSKQVHLQDLTQIKVNQAGTGDIITPRSRDKLKTYFQYQSAYDHQSRQDRNLSWWASAHKVTWSFDHVVLQDHVTN